MPKFLVTKSVDAFINYSAVVEAANADEAREIAENDDDSLDWHETSTAEFDNVDFDNIPPEQVLDGFMLEPETDLTAEMLELLKAIVADKHIEKLGSFRLRAQRLIDKAERR